MAYDWISIQEAVSFPFSFWHVFKSSGVRYSFVLFQKGPIALLVISFRRSRYGQKVLYVSVPLSFCCDVILDSLQCHCSEGKTVVGNIWFFYLFSSLDRVVHYAFGQCLSLFLVFVLPHVTYCIWCCYCSWCNLFTFCTCSWSCIWCSFLHRVFVLDPIMAPQVTFQDQDLVAMGCIWKVKVSNLARMSKKIEKLQKSNLSKNIPIIPKNSKC